ncbi:MAG: DNA polymerase III subunit delta [Bacteroidetes bacterium]|nr:DNA polymerase III subunit delta [Bacteroidota bacterium]MCL2302164.1 DNA polymerase III subunit delta [Lentimicrobiaceae bacterium]
MLFKSVLVSPALKNQLVALVKENRISHAQLFLSQAGAHSFALAIAYAQYICCQDRKENDSCGICPSCVKFEKLAHPDLHFVFPNCITKTVKKDPDSRQFAQEFRDFVFAKNYHIDIEDWLSELGGENKQATINIRDCSNIIQQNSIQSYEGGYKIFIFWCLDRLYHTAAPKLLKTLEEPEKNTLFILLTENPDKILATILSRTQLVKIPPINQDTIAQQLVKDFGIPAQKAADIAEISEGSYVKAINLNENNKELRDMLQKFETFFTSMSALKNHASPQQINFFAVQDVIASIVDSGREEQKNFLRFASRMIRNILMLGTQNENLVKATTEEKKTMSFFTKAIVLKNAQSILHECNQALFHIERNGNSTLVFTDFYLKVSKLML